MAWTPTEAPCGLDYFNKPSIPEWEHTLLQCFLKEKKLQVLHLATDGQSVVKSTDYFVLEFGRLRDVLVAPNGRVFVCTSNQEPNGASVVQPDDDKIIEIINPNYQYPDPPEITVSAASEMRAFPVPTNNAINLVMPEGTEPLNYALLDMNGHILASGVACPALLSGVCQLEFDWVASGVYLLRVEASNGQFYTNKVVMVRE